MPGIKAAVQPGSARPRRYETPGWNPAGGYENPVDGTKMYPTVFMKQTQHLLCATKTDEVDRPSVMENRLAEDNKSGLTPQQEQARWCNIYTVGLDRFAPGKDTKMQREWHDTSRWTVLSNGNWQRQETIEEVYEVRATIHNDTFTYTLVLLEFGNETYAHEVPRHCPTKFGCVSNAIESIVSQLCVTDFEMWGQEIEAAWNKKY